MPRNARELERHTLHVFLEHLQMRTLLAGKNLTSLRPSEIQKKNQVLKEGAEQYE